MANKLSSELAMQKAQNLLACIQHGLQVHDQQRTNNQLGNRSQYIGISDIGRYLECPRAALCNKVFSKPPSTLQKLITLQRGHWLEYGIGQAFTAQALNSITQLELSFSHNNTPIKAHFDFILAWEKPHHAIRILELKSTQNLPKELYSAYEMQLYGQVSLLSHLWNEPVFNLRANDGTILYQNYTMPKLCFAHFGINMPEDIQSIDIEAWILCISMEDAKAFGPYKPNISMKDLCIKTAQELWEQSIAYNNGDIHYNDIAYALGFYPLCAYCDWNSDCPKFQNADIQEQYSKPLNRLDELKAQVSALDIEINDIEQSLKNTFSLISPQGDWVNTGSHRFKVSQQKGRRSLNKDNLRQILQNKYDVDSLFASCEQEGKPFKKLTINKIN